MNTFDRIGFRGACGGLAAVLCLGLAYPAGAWDQPQWVRQLGTPEYDSAAGVATDHRGGVYIVGTTSGSLGGPNQGEIDAFIAKYSAAGALLWIRQRGTPAADLANGVAADDRGGVYIAETGARLVKYSASGSLLWERQPTPTYFETATGVATDVRGDAYIVGGTLGSLAGPNQGYEDAWIAKYSRVGILLWKRQLGTSQIDAASGVAIDRNGNAYVSGNTQTYCVRCAGELNAWLVKYSASGSFIWKRQLPSGSRNSVSGVATDDKSYVYIAGWTTGSLGGPNQGSYDAWLAKYSPAGLLLWIQQLGTPDGDFARGLATDDKGGVYIVGDTDSISGDAWIAKYSGAGALLWKRRLGTPAFDQINAVAADDKGGVYAVGLTSGSLGGPNRGNTDAFIAKYSQRP